MSDGADRHYLAPLFEPASVAIIGASDRPGSVGTVLAQNMAATFRGPLHLINPKHASIRGAACYPAIGKAPRAA